MVRAFPSAPIYTTLFDAKRTYPEFTQHDIRMSWLSRLPLLNRFHRLALPLLAWAAATTNIDAGCTIASSSGWAHGFRSTGAKIVYCYSPARWLYQPDAYLGSSGLTAKRLVLNVLAPCLKRWDKRNASTAVKYFAISSAVQKRIHDAYGIEAEVLPAPHSMDATQPQEPVDLSSMTAQRDYYLCISRLLPYKNVDVVIEAFNALKLPLVVVGGGPEERKLRAMAGPTIRMTKDLTDAQIRWLYARCTAVVSASYEDFGLTPIEGAVFGKPSIVLRWGGFLDTVRDGETGVFFDDPSPGLLCEAVTASRGRRWDSDEIKRHSNAFSEEAFAARLTAECSSLTGRCD